MQFYFKFCYATVLTATYPRQCCSATHYYYYYYYYYKF
jgi:hypothetical protein